MYAVRWCKAAKAATEAHNAKATAQGDATADTASETQKHPTEDGEVQLSKENSNNLINQSAKYSYEFLVAKPDMTITEMQDASLNSRVDIAKEAKNKAAKIGKVDKTNGSVSVYVNDINADVVLATKGLRHGLDYRMGPNTLVTLYAGSILKNSIRINEIVPRNSNVSSSYVLIGCARNSNGELYVVRSIVNRFSNELVSMDVLYAINAKKESAATKSPRLAAKPLSVTDSTISIADLLKIVNTYFPDVLPAGVLQHFGYDARPNGDLGDSILYSLPDQTASEYLKKMLADEAIAKATKAQIYADSPLYDVLHDTDRFAAAQEILRDKNRVIGITKRLSKGEAATAEEITALILMQNAPTD